MHILASLLLNSFFMKVCSNCTRDETQVKFHKGLKHRCSLCYNARRQAQRAQKILDKELHTGPLLPDKISCKRCGIERDSDLDFEIDNLSTCKACLGFLGKQRKIGKFSRYLILGAMRRTREDPSLPPCTLTEQDISIPEIDPVLGIPMVIGVDRSNQGSSPSIDRLIPEGGYVPANCRIISHRANSIKNNAEPWELLKVCAYSLQIHKDKIPNYQETVNYIQWLAEKLKPS